MEPADAFDDERPDFWPLDPSDSQRLLDVYRSLRTENPVAVTHVAGRAVWLVTSYELCRLVFFDTETFSSRTGGIGTPPSPAMKVQLAEVREALGGYQRVNTLLTADPPAHNRYRKLVAKAFSPRATAKLQPLMEMLCADLINSWIGDGRVELVSQMSEPLAISATAHLLGIPEDRTRDFKRWSQATSAAQRAGITDEERLDAERGIVELQLFLVDHIASRRAHPSDDVVTDLINARIDGDDPDAGAEPLSDAEILDILQQLLVAGQETTSRTLTEMIRQLAEDTDKWQELRTNPEMAPQVVEETLRMSSPGQGLWRRATRDTVLNGIPIPEGGRVALMIASANRDAAAFNSPDEFCPSRQNLQDHLAFGKGVHYCLGAAVARLELRTALTALAHCIESFVVTTPSLEYDLSIMLRGIVVLELSIVPDTTYDRAEGRLP